MSKNIIEVTMKTDNVHEIDKYIIIGKLKKEWIRTPKELGSKKLKVIDEFETICSCGKHNTTLYILDGDYFTVNCTKGWAWYRQPENRNDLYKMKI